MPTTSGGSRPACPPTRRTGSAGSPRGGCRTSALCSRRTRSTPSSNTSGACSPMSVTLAAELLHKGLWYPTILGVLVVVAGIGLFCGSIYLLLGTNLGARLGFLVAFTGLTGFMVILTLLWSTTASPLNTLKGRLPAWQVKQVVLGNDLSKAKI